MSTWLTVAELVARTGRASATIRHWRTAHPDYLRMQPDARGHQTYELERVEEIGALYALRLTSREVQAELTRRHTGTAPEPVPPTEQTWRAEVTERLERIENALERLVSLVTERNDADEDVPH